MVAYTVARRTREMGIRFALGASRGEVVRQAVGGGLKAVAGGLVVGLPLAVLAGSLLRSLLLGVGPFDPVSLLGVPTLLILVALAATWTPARRAARLDPVTALRSE